MYAISGNHVSIVLNYRNTKSFSGDEITKIEKLFETNAVLISNQIHIKIEQYEEVLKDIDEIAKLFDTCIMDISHDLDRYYQHELFISSKEKWVKVGEYKFDEYDLCNEKELGIKSNFI